MNTPPSPALKAQETGVSVRSEDHGVRLLAAEDPLPQREDAPEAADETCHVQKEGLVVQLLLVEPEDETGDGQENESSHDEPPGGQRVEEPRPAAVIRENNCRLSGHNDLFLSRFSEHLYYRPYLFICQHRSVQPEIVYAASQESVWQRRGCGSKHLWFPRFAHSEKYLITSSALLICKRGKGIRTFSF